MTNLAAYLTLCVAWLSGGPLPEGCLEGNQHAACVIPEEVLLHMPTDSTRLVSLSKVDVPSVRLTWLDPACFALGGQVWPALVPGVEGPASRELYAPDGSLGHRVVVGNLSYRYLQISQGCVLSVELLER